MNHRSRFFRSGLISAAGVLAAGVAFFVVPSPGAYASTSCSDCYVVTPATNPATAGAGTGDVYAFRVTNNDPNEHLVSLTFTCARRFRHHSCHWPERDLGLVAAGLLRHAKAAE